MFGSGRRVMYDDSWRVIENSHDLIFYIRRKNQDSLPASFPYTYHLTFADVSFKHRELRIVRIIIVEALSFHLFPPFFQRIIYSSFIRSHSYIHVAISFGCDIKNMRSTSTTCKTCKFKSIGTFVHIAENVSPVAVCQFTIFQIADFHCSH